MKNLLLRSLTGSLYVGLILISLLIHPLALAVLSGLFAFFAIREFFNIQGQQKHVHLWAVMLSILLFISASLLHLCNSKVTMLLPIILAYMSLFISSLYYKGEEGTRLFQLNSTALLYIALPLLLLNLIWQKGEATQIPYALLLFVGIWSNDSFAYLFGISLGKHRLFERISPKKSWEGFFGGLLMTLAAAWGYYYFTGSQSLGFWLGFGALVVVSATFGDLVESMLKRNAGIKDSGNLLPGHGGILDRIDSLLFVSPVIYAYILLF